MKVLGVLFALALVLVPLNGTTLSTEVAQERDVVIIAANKKGLKTLDRDAYGGNPFASALIESLAQNPTDTGAFLDLLQDYSERFSHGIQSPEVLGFNSMPRAPILPANSSNEMRKSSTHVALVVVIAEYDGDAALPPLPGAAFDAVRVSNAFEKAGYRTEMSVVKRASDYLREVTDFGRRSKEADVAVIYTTGHGVQIGDVIYILDSSFAISSGVGDFDNRAVNLARVEEVLEATSGNFLFYAGCRDNPFQPEHGATAQ